MSPEGVAVASLAFATVAAARRATSSRHAPEFRSGSVRPPQGWVDTPRTAWGAVGRHLERRLGRRRRAPEVDLPALLEAVAARLRAGGSLAQALVEAAPPPGGPLADQWRRTVELVPAVGAVGALRDWAARAEQRSVRLAAAALTLAATTGGPPARAIDGVAATLRSRLALQAEIRALSSQARASAVVIVLAPAVFGVLAGLTDPRTAAFLRTPLGLLVVVAGLGLDGLGGWWMARLCRVPAQ